MRHPYDEHSDQEELVENLFSAAEDDDDEDDEDEDDEDDDEEQENIPAGRIHLDAETEELISISLVKSSNDCDALLQMERNSNFQIREQQQHKQNSEVVRKTKRQLYLLLAFGVGLMVTSFALLVLIPLYQSQFNAESTKSNSHGMLMFVQPLATLFFILVTIVCSAIFKWNIRLLKLPSIPGTKLCIISMCFGLASALVVVGSYKRVACHLQDPLKGTALASSLLFYFFFCTRLMGLQKIFSATTSVVGLFISVDYGLCDEFHCHGNIISYQEKPPHSGWQGRAFWALIYTIGILLWSLHIAILEGCLVDGDDSTQKQTTFLKTISKFVASYDEQRNSNPATKDKDVRLDASKKNMHPMHIAMWIQIIGTVFALIFGFVDIFPVSGTQVKTLSQHWTETKYTFRCHINMSSHHDVVFDSHSNTSSGSVQATIMNFIPISQHTSSSSDHSNRTKRSSIMESRRHPHKISHLNAFLKYKNTTSNHLPSKSGNLKAVGHENIQVDCSHNSGFYALILVCTYVGFVACLFNFLSLSQSAVFTVAMATGTLPLIGLFWSFYKLDTQNSLNATIIWSPSVSGELICSLLGTPIVFLGIVFLFKAHYHDMLKQSQRASHQVMVT